jgi:uncharacterized Zn finger protein
MRENFASKGRRLLTEGRLNVEHVDARTIRATCRGDSDATYHLRYNGTGWACSCPALSRCSHICALQLVTVRERA